MSFRRALLESPRLPSKFHPLPAQLSSPSEYTNRRLLDVVLQHRMQAITCRDIHLHSQLGLQQKLDVDQVQQAELAAGVVIDEDVEVAIRISFVSDCRAKHIERGRSHRPDGVGVSFSLLTASVLF